MGGGRAYVSTFAVLKGPSSSYSEKGVRQRERGRERERGRTKKRNTREGEGERGWGNKANLFSVSRCQIFHS